MDLQEYRLVASVTDCNNGRNGYPPWLSKLLYTSNALVGEAGELANVVKKIAREAAEDGPDICAPWPSGPQDDRRKEALLELGDVFWYWLALCDRLGVTPEAVWAANAAKLRDRYPHRFTPEAKREEFVRIQGVAEVVRARGVCRPDCRIGGCDGSGCWVEAQGAARCATGKCDE